MHIFTYKNYRSILRYMKKINNIYSFESLSNAESGIILRHDVDFNLEKAYAIANIEKEENITSTYFLLVTSDFYNICSRTNKSIIKRISSYGFEIGLHFDPIVYGDIDLCEMQNKVEKECCIIENIIGTRVKTISLHNPSIHNQYP